MQAQSSPKIAEFTFTDGDFATIASMVKKTMGIVLKESKRDMVYGRLVRRLRALDMGEVSEYIKYLQSPAGKDETEDFVNALTTNLTHFFREAHQFDHLNTVLDTLSKSKTRRKYRIWSAGCSSGMEAYSIAMTAASAINDIKHWDFKILASDIDTNMLEVGMKGIYTPKDVEPIPELLRKAYVHKKKKEGPEYFELHGDLKKIVKFKKLNLLESWPMKGMFDVIFCRNVIIYFDKETQAKLFDRMANQMVEGGWLYIGHSENISNVTKRFKLVGSNVYRKVGA